MKESLKQEAVDTVYHIMELYYCERNIDEVLGLLEDEVTWIGPGVKEVKFSFSEIRNYFEMGKEAIPKCEISDGNLQAFALSEDLCAVIGTLMVRTGRESHMLVEVNQRLSFVLRLREQGWKVVHMHLSNPYMEMKSEEYFPSSMGEQNYEYLQRLLHEKTEVIDMITANINGGLKGSNDDDTYSYFYVNEGLPRMLGYTYEEFMEKTGGTAVGAVYPPDLQTALEDCVRCFAKGQVYSTEYRMEKKDGGLMWVLDSGRKAPDSSGTTKINSIIMDITPLKKALFDLEIEQERYKVALENISDVLCEYDIRQDLFTTYQRVEVDGRSELEKFEIPFFSKAVNEKALVHPEDVGILMDVYLGKNQNPVEVRNRFFHLDAAWRFSRCSCTMILGRNGEPVKAIGMMKDITEEREKNMELLKQAQCDGLTNLLNQTAVKEAVSEYLRDADTQNGCRGAFLMVDLDQFKRINDTKGHLFGNDVLAATAKAMTESMLNGDIAGRTGGDEFVLLLKKADREEAVRQADIIIKKVRGICGEDRLSVSCSIGIAYLSENGEAYDDLFRRADMALYQAKNNGRNQWSESAE